MSYTIIYRKQFLAVNGKIVPMILAGDNNVYEPHGRYERRAREWSTLHLISGKLAYEPNELRALAKEYFGGRDGQLCKIGSVWADGDRMVSYINNGIDNAMTIEEIQAQCLAHVRGLLDQCEPDPKNGTWKHSRNTDYLHSSEEIEAWIRKAEDLVNKYADDIERRYTAYISFDMEQVRAYKPLPDDVPVIVKSCDKMFVSGSCDKMFVSGITERGISMSSKQADAMIFSNSRAAVSVIPHGYVRGFIPASVLEKEKPERRFAVMTGKGAFVTKLSKLHLWSTLDKENHNIKRFGTENEARKWCEKYRIEERFSGISGVRVVEITAC